MKRLESKEAIALGRRLLEQEVERLHPELGELTDEILLRVASEFKHASVDELLNEVGLGNRMPSLIIRMLAGDVELHRFGLPVCSVIVAQADRNSFLGLAAKVLETLADTLP